MTKVNGNKMYTIRHEKQSDFEDIRTVNILAFDNQSNEASLIEAIRRSELFIPELSLVAVTKDEVIGHILISPIIIETENGEFPTLGLAPMSVKPGYQGMGIGSKLVTEGLKVSRELGHQHVFVLGHPDFYPKFGFIPSKSSFGIESPFPVQDQYFMALELEPDSLKGINGKVKYPTAFDVVS